MNRTTDSKRPRDWATIPNAVTLLRFALVAPVAVLLVDGSRPVLAVVLLAIFGASDWVDGALARKLGQTSKTGAVLDPVADRIGVAVIALALVMAGHVSIWVALGIAAVDVALGALLQRLAAVRGRLSLCADQAAAAKWWLSMPMASVSAEGPMPKALSTRRTSPLMPGCRHQGRACPLRRARMTSNPLIVA